MPIMSNNPRVMKVFMVGRTVWLTDWPGVGEAQRPEGAIHPFSPECRRWRRLREVALRRAAEAGACLLALLTDWGVPAETLIEALTADHAAMGARNPPPYLATATHASAARRKATSLNRRQQRHSGGNG